MNSKILFLCFFLVAVSCHRKAGDEDYTLLQAGDFFVTSKEYEELIRNPALLPVVGDKDAPLLDRLIEAGIVYSYLKKNYRLTSFSPDEAIQLAMLKKIKEEAVFITERELKKVYESAKEQLIVNEVWISEGHEKVADSLYALVKAGASVEEIQGHFPSFSKAPELKFQTNKVVLPGTYSFKIAKEIYDLNINEANLFNISSGFLIVLLVNKVPLDIEPFDDVRAEIRTRLVTASLQESGELLADPLRLDNRFYCNEELLSFIDFDIDPLSALVAKENAFREGNNKIVVTYKNKAYTAGDIIHAADKLPGESMYFFINSQTRYNAIKSFILRDAHASLLQPVFSNREMKEILMVQEFLRTKLPKDFISAKGRPDETLSTIFNEVRGTLESSSSIYDSLLLQLYANGYDNDEQVKRQLLLTQQTGESKNMFQTTADLWLRPELYSQDSVICMDVDLVSQLKFPKPSLALNKTIASKGSWICTAGDFYREVKNYSLASLYELTGFNRKLEWIKYIDQFSVRNQDDNFHELKIDRKALAEMNVYPFILKREYKYTDSSLVASYDNLTMTVREFRNIAAHLSALEKKRCSNICYRKDFIKGWLMTRYLVQAYKKEILKMKAQIEQASENNYKYDLLDFYARKFELAPETSLPDYRLDICFRYSLNKMKERETEAMVKASFDTVFVSSKGIEQWNMNVAHSRFRHLIKIR